MWSGDSSLATGSQHEEPYEMAVSLLKENLASFSFLKLYLTVVSMYMCVHVCAGPSWHVC